MGGTALANHVGHVLLRSAQPEVVGVAAGRVIAGVTDLLSWRHRAISQLPDHPGSHPQAPEQPYLDLAALHLSAGARPAFFRASDPDFLPNVVHGNPF